MLKLISMMVFVFSLLVIQFEIAHAASEVYRFEKKQISFVMLENGFAQTKCQHEIKSHVPWWSVKCGDREFTVDAWLQLHQRQLPALTKLDLMFHVSEGVISAGTKLTQFNDHHTTMFLEGHTLPKKLVSSMDIRNGLASLKLKVEFQ